MQSSIQSNRQAPYISQQPGWNIVFVALLIAGIFGLSFRLYFSPKRIKEWIESELKRQPAKIELTFETAELRLSRGSLPQLAIRLTEVEGRSEKSCSTTPGFSVSEIYIPFRVLALLQGRVAVGTVHGESAQVDLDALRDRCDRATASGTTLDSLSAPESSLDGDANTKARGVAANSTPPVRPWWTPEQLQTVRNLVGGISFESVKLTFEHGAKYVQFEDLRVKSDAGVDALSLATDVRLPPELVYGQSVPAFAIEALVRPDSAQVEWQGNLAEGSLLGSAALKALPGDLAIDAKMTATSVPLSSLVPFARNAGWLKGEMRPKFMWLNCEASITGAVRRLFKENPLRVENCILDGDSGKISLERAAFGPGEKNEPFDVVVSGVDVRKMLDMFNGKGPDGIMSRFGRISGRLSVASREAFVFEGALLDSRFTFSNRSIPVEQPVPEIRTQVTFKDARYQAVVEEATLLGGRFKGRVTLDMDRKFRDGTLDVDIQELLFAPAVQNVMTSGEVGGIAIAGKGELVQGKLKQFKGDVTVRDLIGPDVRVIEGRFKTSLVDGTTHLEARAPAGEIRRASKLFETLEPVFLGHAFNGEWISIKDLSANLALRDRILNWDKASALLRAGQITLMSSGQRDAHGNVSAWVSADYPKLKKLRWEVAGKAQSPVFTPNEATEQMLRQQTISDTTLGLSVPASEKAAAAAAAAEASDQERGSGIQALSQKVLERAKSILPTLDSHKIKPASTSREEQGPPTDTKPRNTKTSKNSKPGAKNGTAE